jgi:hypothetical protein
MSTSTRYLGCTAFCQGVNLGHCGDRAFLGQLNTGAFDRAGIHGKEPLFDG